MHSRYERCLSDPATGGQETVIRLRVRRFFCDNRTCVKRTFAERIAGVTVAHARRIPLLRRMLERIALALGGRPGQRLTRRLAVEVSRSTLLRLVRALPLPKPGATSMIGVDDFAFRRGHTYGTIVIDMDTHQPLDVLPDRLSSTFGDWLRAHPGAKVICRDRASGYAEGARLGAPEAIQVADRFHLLYNLTKAVDRVVRVHWTRRRCAAMRERRTADELLTQVVRRGSELDVYTEFLAQRWQEGCTNAAWLTEELRARGYRGSERTVRRLLHTWRGNTTPPTAIATTTPKPRQVTGWIIRPAADRTDEEQRDLARIVERCPVLRTVDELVGNFGRMLRHRRGEHLDTWIAQVQASYISQLQGFAAGLLKDYDAVRNGLALAWSSGAVEGTVCKIKALKRQMFGRANFDLLRRRILLGN